VTEGDVAGDRVPRMVKVWITVAEHGVVVTVTKDDHEGTLTRNGVLTAIIPTTSDSVV